MIIKKAPGDIIILHLCTKNLDDMISSWDIECDRLKFVIIKNPKNQAFGNTKKMLEIPSFYKFVLKTTIIWGMVPEV